MLRYVLRNINQEYLSCKGTVIMSHQNRFLVVSKSSDDSFTWYLTVEMEKWFDHASISVYSGLVIIPSKMVSLVYKNVKWKENFSLFPDLFKDHFPSPKALEAELDSWETYWLESKDCLLPDNISHTLKLFQLMVLLTSKFP